MGKFKVFEEMNKVPGFRDIRIGKEHVCTAPLEWLDRITAALNKTYPQVSVNGRRRPIVRKGSMSLKEYLQKRADWAERSAKEKPEAKYREG